MKPALTYECLHNPFHNRFNVPVTSRLDEMQSVSYEALFGNRSNKAHSNVMTGSNAFDPTHWGRLMASGIALLLFLLASLAAMRIF